MDSMRTAPRLTVLAGACSLVAAAWTVAAQDRLTGPAAMNGSARGTAVVVLLAALPVLAVSTTLAARGSQRALITWLGSLGYLLYNAVLFLFATPFNAAFLCYVAMLGTTSWAVGATLRLALTRAPVDAPSAPLRAVAVFVWVMAGLNAAAWLRVVVPGLDDPYPPAFLAGTGLTTNPVHVQDLALWLPLAAVSAWWLWQGRARGRTLVGALLGVWVLEGVSIAVDQWFGHQADPTSDVVSSALVGPFLVLAAVTAAPLGVLLRSVQDEPETSVAVPGRALR